MNRVLCRGFLLAALCLAAALVHAAEEFGSGDDFEPLEFGFSSGNPAHAEADEALNEASTHLGDAARAEERIARLTALADKFPDYKYRADLLYYVGLNAQLLRKYGQAANAFTEALEIKPDIAFDTAIEAYLETARHRVFLHRTNLALIAVLVIVMLPALLRLSRPDAVSLPWGRLFAVFAVAAALWSLVVFLLPRALGPAEAGLDNFPQPALCNFHLGQMGDNPLRALWLYGIGALLAVLPVTAAATLVRRRAASAVLMAAGATLTIAGVLGLYYVRNLYDKVTYHAPSHRLILLTKSLDTVKEVPEEMYKLYHKKFANEVRRARGEPEVE